MRVVWIVGGHEGVRLQFEKQFATNRYGGSFLVRRAEALEEIPSEHLNNPGVVVCVDAFHPTLGGFEGIRRLREQKFTGPVFLFGEPAPEFASTMWEELAIVSFLPPFDRLDVTLACGLIYYRLSFEGSIDAGRFLAPTGRASSEVIHSVAELNTFATKLASFVGRFGLDLQQLKKVIMGLTLPHIKVGPSGPSVEPVFTVVYGLDPMKLVLGVSSYSRGASRAVFRHEMVAALSGLQQTRTPVSSILPEIHHVVRATRNVVVYSGSSKVESESTDPLFVLTTLHFDADASQKKGESQQYHATLAFVGPAPEMSEAEARLEPTRPAVEPEVTHEVSAPAIDEGPQSTAPEATLDAVDLEKILAEPKLLGDAPEGESQDFDLVSTSEPGVESASAEEGTEGGELGVVSDRASPELVKEIERLKALNAAMSFDVKRLLAERREPSSDKELRESYRDLDEKFRKLTKERQSLQSRLEEKDKQIELLQAQVEALRRSSAA